jgi:hypothetical protein
MCPVALVNKKEKVEWILVLVERKSKDNAQFTPGLAGVYRSLAL